MAEELELHSTDEAFVLADRINKSGLIPAAYRGKPADIAIAMLYGAEMGMPPMSSLQRVVVINGKPTMDAQGMVALIRQSGHSISGDMSSVEAKVTGKRGDNGDTMTVTFTIEDAKKADLVKRGSPWEKFAEDMLWARAVSRLGRRLFADVLLGVSYVPEEMEAVVASTTTRRAPSSRTPSDVSDADEETGEIVDAEIVLTPDEQMIQLAELVRSHADAEGLADHLRDQFGPASEMNPDDIAAAIEVAKGWAGEVATVDEPAATTTRRAPTRKTGRPPLAEPRPEGGDESGAEPTSTRGNGDTPNAATQKQVNMIRLRFANDRGITDATEIIDIVSAWVGHDVGSLEDLTKSEASKVIDQTKETVDG